MNLKYSLYLISTFLFLGCGDDEIDCQKALNASYGSCENCQIQTDNRIDVNFKESDTLIFSYKGTDTLIFEHRDSLGNIDTVEYIGQGKNSKVTGAKPGDFGDDCVRSVRASYFSIEFLSNKTKHKPLVFDLWAGWPSTHFRYNFMNANLDAIIWGIENGNGGGYMPVFNFRGQEYYHVTPAKVTSAKGLTTFYISKESQLVFTISSDSSYYLKIN